MSNLISSLIFTGLLLVSQTGFADDVQLPAPVLQYSFYIFLIFALFVTIGIFFIRTKQGIVNEQPDPLLGEGLGPVHAVGPDTTITECARRMGELRIGAMLVMDNDRLVGIFTERDCLNRVIGEGRDPGTTRVAEVMTKEPICVSPKTTVEYAMSICRSRRIRHLPIVRDKQLLGVVSSGDLARRLLSR